jgi:hypothetical protein
MVRVIAAVFALAIATSAQAMSPAPLHQSDGMTLPSSADRVGHWLAVSACPESPNAKFAGVRCGVQGTFAVGGIEPASTGLSLSSSDVSLGFTCRHPWPKKAYNECMTPIV